MGADISKEERRREEDAIRTGRQLEEQRRRYPNAGLAAGTLTNIATPAAQTLTAAPAYRTPSAAPAAHSTLTASAGRYAATSHAAHSTTIAPARYTTTTPVAHARTSATGVRYSTAAPAAHAATIAPARYTTTSPVAHARTSATGVRYSTAAPAAHAATIAPARYTTTSPVAHARTSATGVRYSTAAPAAHAATTAAARDDSASPATCTTTPAAAAPAASTPHAGLATPTGLAAAPRSPLQTPREMTAYRYTAEDLRSMSSASTSLYPDLSESRANTHGFLSQPSRTDTLNQYSASDNESHDFTVPAARQAEATRSVNKISQDFGNRGSNERNPANNDERNGNSTPIPKIVNEVNLAAQGAARTYNSSMHTPPSTSTAASKGIDDDFVFVNNNYSKQRFNPSAPPERDLPRSRNASRNRIAGGSEPDETRCATCDRQFTLEIYQCGGGHSVCERCRARGARCAACGEDVLPMRNHQLEELIREKRAECPNTVDGCSLRPRRVDMPQHLMECIFRVMDCPMTSVYGLCTWKGKREDMKNHFFDRHPEHCKAQVNHEMTLRRLDRDDRILHFIPLDNYIFLVHIKISEASQTLALAVQLIGTANGAGKWRYAVNVYNRDEPRRKLDYGDACTPEGDDVAGVFAQARCLVLPLAYVRGFESQYGVTYKVFITRAEGARGARGVPNRGRGRGWGRGASR